MTDKETVSIEQAREALDSLDDYARMDTGVDAFGPRGVLERFIEQQALTATAPSAPGQEKVNGDPVSFDQAREALDSLDDYARMDVGVDAYGPRGILERSIEQQARAALRSE